MDKKTFYRDQRLHDVATLGKSNIAELRKIKSKIDSRPKARATARPKKGGGRRR